MNKEELAMIGFEIVAYSGEARSKFLEAIENVKNNGSEERTRQLIEEGNECLTKAHNSHSKLLSKEASGEDLELGFICVHGEDHLMTTILLKDILDHLINIYKK